MPARRTAAILITAAALVAAPVALAAPASAAGPDSTAILGPAVFPEPTNEEGPLELTVECGTNATSAALVYQNLTDSSDGLYGVGLDANQQGTFSEDPTRNMGDPGDQLSLTLECLTGPLSSPTLLATSAPQLVTLIDVGAAISVPDVEVDQAIAISGTCGVGGAEWAMAVVQYPGITNESELLFVVAAVAADGTYSFGIPSAASARYAPGEAFAQVICGVGPAPTLPLDSFPELTLSIRSTAFQVLPASLPATGAAIPAEPIAIAALAIIGGLVVSGARAAALSRR